MVKTGTAFVSDAPHDDTRVVLIALVHSLGAVKVACRPRGIGGERSMIAVDAHAVTFNVGFVDYEKSVLIAKLCEARIVWIVGGSDSVYVVTLHYHQILDHV